jgi:hypothetical protein
MNGKNDISDELKALSILVDGISRQHPYTVPAGYFDTLAQQVLSRIASKSLTFTVPDGYFDNFASRVLDRIKAGKATEVFSGTPEIGAIPEIAATSEIAATFEIPNVFFGESVQEELARLSATVSRISRETPYLLPEGYFDELSPVLTLLKDRPTYEAPVGYFDALAADATAKIGRAGNDVPHVGKGAAIETGNGPTHHPAKVIGIGSRGKVLTGNWWKYSAAAMIAGVILALSWPQLHTANMNATAHAMPIDLSNVLAKVSDQEMQTYLDDQQTILSEPVTNSTANLDINDSDVKSLLGDVPDGELKQYMEEHGRANDIATN